MPNEDNKILKYNHGEKSLEAPFFISFDRICIIKMPSFQNIPEKSYTDRKSKNIPSGYACGLTCSFEAI